MKYKTMKTRMITALLAIVCGLAAQAATNPYLQYTQNLPFAMPEVKAPVFPDRVFNIKDYGAKGDGTSLCTAAFAKAIDELNAKGGGRLIVPQGVWFTGPIVLKSNVNLH